MSILEEVKTLLSPLNSPIETGVYKGVAVDSYIVLVPLADGFELHADNKPNADIQEVRISIYSKTNYVALKNKIVKLLFSFDFAITDRRYIGYETETGYYHYVVDTEKNYELED